MSGGHRESLRQRWAACLIWGDLGVSCGSGDNNLFLSFFLLTLPRKRDSTSNTKSDLCPPCVTVRNKDNDGVERIGRTTVGSWKDRVTAGMRISSGWSLIRYGLSPGPPKGEPGLFCGHFSCRQEMDSGWLHYQLRVALEQIWMIQCWRNNLAVRARNQTLGRLVMMSSLSLYSTPYKSRMVSLFDLYHSFFFIIVCVLWRSALSIRTRPGGR
jgi:hypothetical protein